MHQLIARWSPERDVWESDQTDLFSGRSDVFSGTWPASGMTRAGTAYALPTSERRTGGGACSSLLGTPRADMGSMTAKPRSRLETDIGQLLPTPSLSNANRGGSPPEDRVNHTVNLQDVVEWLNRPR